MPDQTIELPQPGPDSQPDPESQPNPEPGARLLPFPFPFQADTNISCICDAEHYDISDLPFMTAQDAQQAPIYHDHYYLNGDGARFNNEGIAARRLFVGTDQGTDHIGDLELAGERGDFEMRHGILDDGVGAGTVANYLTEAVLQDGLVRRHVSPPQLRFGGEASADDINRLVRAVQLVNTALPLDWRIQMPSEEPTPETGEGIYVEFVPRLQSGAGLTRYFVSVSPAHLAHAKVSIDRGNYTARNERLAAQVLIHEIVHAIGILRHVSPDFDTVMQVGNPSYIQGTLQPMSLLYSEDREAIRALYGRLHNGDTPTDFGAWAGTSTHVHANGEHAAFGVAWRNGYGEPWAHGYLPATDLADNTALTGRAIWRGVLLGFTPGQAYVAGDARIGITLADLTGTANFTNLEAWEGMMPGDPGTGTQWLDGDLAYAIAVRGNIFQQTGGDAGFLTGAFFGEEHEGMGGTLERDDLASAFGGTR